VFYCCTYHIPSAEGTTEGEELVKKADAATPKSFPKVYLINPTLRTADSDTFPWWTLKSPIPVYYSKPTS